MGKVEPAEKQLVKAEVTSLPPVTQASIRRIIQYPEGTDIDPRQIRPLTADDIITIANQIARDIDGHAQVDVLTVPNPSNLDVALSTRASEATLQALKNALASVGTDKLRTTLVDPLPPGTNTIGNVNAQILNFPTEYPLPSAQIADLKNVNILREGSYIPFNLTFTAAGTQTIYTPSSGKKAKVLGFCVKCTADVDWEIRYASSLNLICGLPFKGAILMNGIGLETPVGATDEAIQAYAGGACTIKGWLAVKEV
jgi:hypothetical protein